MATTNPTSRRGRPRKSAEPSLIEQEPGADAAPEGRPKAAPRGRPFVGRAEQVAQVSGLIEAINLPLKLAAPADALTDQEVAMLANALLDDSFTKNYVAKIQGATHVKLIQVAIVLSLPRMERHGLLPSIPGFSIAPPVPVDAGGARGNSGEDWNGQNATGFPIPPGSPLHGVPGDESRPLQPVSA